MNLIERIRMVEHQPLPVAGYTQQADAKVSLVNEFKADEERLLRKIEALTDHDKRWAAVAFTHFQQGFMALNRAVFQPNRVMLPEDYAAAQVAPASVDPAKNA